MSKGGGNEDPAMAVALIVIVLLIAAAIIWYLFRDQIINAIRIVRIAELNLIKYFANDVVMPGGSRATPRQLLGWLSGSTADNLSWDQMAAISRTIVPQFFRWPTAIIFFVFAGIAYKFSASHKLSNVYDLEGLIGAQGRSWPVITPILRFNPATAVQRALGQPVPDELPLFSEALSPEEWLAFHQISIQERQIDRDAAERAFVKQLGARWQGPDKLPPHVQALFAVFALKGARKREDADKLLGEISLCWTPKQGLRLTGALKTQIRRILRDPKTRDEAVKIASNHAFIATAMIGCLIWCRAQGGVLAPASFLWLRGTDRNLWYALNNAGRRTFHAEASGVAAHFFAERMLKRALPMPKVESAINALQDYMNESDLPLPSLNRVSKNSGPPNNGLRIAAPA